jgi:hypothetical protein
MMKSGKYPSPRNSFVAADVGATFVIRISSCVIFNANKKLFVIRGSDGAILMANGTLSH